MPTLTLRELFAEYANGRRDFRGATITTENGWALPPRSDLSALILSDASLKGIRFEGADLRNSEFSRASLVGADLSQTVLIGAMLSESDLTGADLTGTSCSEANFNGARLSNAAMTGSSLCRADLTGAQAESATFRDADLRDSILTGATLSNASFRNADLSRADLRVADFSSADLSMADLTDCHGDHARFNKAVLSGADVAGISLANANLASAHLFELSWLNSDLTGANLDSARLDGASIRNCRLVRVYARHALLSGSVIVDSNLTGIDLVDASLNRCLWQDVTFDHANLDGADLKGAILRRSSGRHTTFSQAQLRAAVIDHATLASIPDATNGLGIAVPQAAEELVPSDNKMFRAAPAIDASIVRVFYATDRIPGADGFGPDRGDRLRYGVCDVSIPRDHRMGELEAPSIWRLQFGWDPNRDLVAAGVSERSPARFFGQLRHRAQASTRREALIFIHGYNVAFEDALRRAGQLAYDLAFDGPAMAYIWASQADVRLYTYDEATVEDTIPRLTTFIQQAVQQSGVQRLHIIAHSMGNRALVRALQQLAANAERPISVNHVILTAPDIDAGAFKGIAAQICAVAQHVTMYASSNDLAIQLSKRFHGYRRAGEGGRQVTIVNGVTTIDASELETDLLGHSYFAEHRSVVSDIYYVLQDQPPQSRFGLLRLRQGRREYWKFRNERQRSSLARLLTWWRRRGKIKGMLNARS